MTRVDSALFLFGIKFTVASLFALAISLASSLPEPKWSIITVAVLANANTDQVTAKSLARIAGTLIGAIVGLTMAALFAEQRVLFLVALCLWLGLCQWLMLWFRDLEAYIFALSGYSAAIVGLPGALDPHMAADIAVSRSSEVCIGIAATWVASVVIFPRYSYLNVMDKVHDAGKLLVTCLNPGQQGASARVQLAGLFTQLHRFGREISDLPEARHRVLAVRSLNRALMSGLFITRALGRPEFHRDDMAALAARLPEALTSEEAARTAQAEWEAAAHKLRAEIVTAHGATAQDRMDNPDAPRSYSAVPWMVFADYCRQLLIGYQALTNSRVAPIPVSGPFHIAGADAIVATMATVQAILSVVLVAIFWLATDWSAGPTAIIIAAIYPLLLTSTSAYRMIIWAVLIAVIPALVISFQIVPMVTTFPMLALAISPFLIVIFMLIGLDGLYKMAGVNALLLFLIPLNPDNVMTYDFATSVNNIVALILSFAICALVLQLLAPSSPWLLRLRLQRTTARALRRAASNTMPLAQRSQMRLTFLTSEIAPAFQNQQPDPFRETEAGYAAGLAATACVELYARVTPGLPWADEVENLRASMARFGLMNWRSGLKDMIGTAARGAEQAHDAMETDTSGRACEAAAAFRIILHALRRLSGLSLNGEDLHRMPEKTEKTEHVSVAT